MKKLLTQTPIVSVIIFSLFLLSFRYLTTHYYVDAFETISIEIEQIVKSESTIIVKMPETGIFSENQKLQLVYSSQKQVLKGYIKSYDTDRMYLYFEDLSNLTEKEILGAEIRIAVGKEAIGREMGL